MPFGGPQFAAQQAQQGGLARTVGPQQSAVAAAFNLPVYVMQYKAPAGFTGQKKAQIFNGHKRF